MKRILLIEDSGDVSYDIKNGLNDCDYEIKHADSYLSAIGMWERYDGQFDCIILDLNINPEGLLPEESSYFFPTIGLSFLKKIRQNENLTKKAKIIIYSAYITEFKVKCSQNNISYSDIIIIEKSGTSFYKLINFIKKIV